MDYKGQNSKKYNKKKKRCKGRITTGMSTLFPNKTIFLDVFLEYKN